jgi:hypothetical protein
MAVTPIPDAPVVPQYPALGSATFNQEAYAYGTAMPNVTQRIHEIAQATRSNAVESGAQAQAAAGSATAADGHANRATAQADAAMGYRNTASAHATTATTQAGIATTKAGEAAASASQASTQKDLAQQAVADAAEQVGLAQQAVADAAEQVGLAAAQAVRAEEAAASIADGPVTSVNNKTGVVTLLATDIAAAATQAEAEAGTEAALRMWSPMRVAQAIAFQSPKPIVGKIDFTADRSKYLIPDWLPCNGAIYLSQAYGALAMLLPNWDIATKLANPAALPVGVGYGCAFSPDGVYLTVTHGTTPYVTIYKRSGDTFTKLANPAALPTGAGNGCAFSPDGVYLTVACDTTPFVTIYKRSGDTFTKLANPAALPTGTSYGCAFSPDGSYMTVAHKNSPFVTIYKPSQDTFTVPSISVGVPAYIKT